MSNSSSTESHEKPAGSGYSKIVAFGDSITYGHTPPFEERWTELLTDLLKQSCGKNAPKIINAGVNGHTSSQGLARIDLDVMTHQPALVLIEFGGNDTRDDADLFVPVQGFFANLRTMHKKITSQGGQVIIMSFPPVVNDWHARGHDSRFNEAGGLDEYVQPYRDAARQLASEFNCEFFDLDKLLRNAAAKEGNEKYVKRDGVHLTAEANQLVAQALAEFLQLRFTADSSATSA